VAGHGELEHEQHDRQADQQHARDVERQAAEADEREDQRDRAEDPGDEVGALQLEDQPIEADRQQDERDVRVGQQVEDRLEWVHRELDEWGVADVDPDRCRTDVDDLAIGLGPDILERRCDAVDGADGDGLERGGRDGLVDGRDRPIDVATARLGDRLDVGDRIVLHLFADRARDVLATGTDR
jgi:hypothetical protein